MRQYLPARRSASVSALSAERGSCDESHLSGFRMLSMENDDELRPADSMSEVLFPFSDSTDIGITCVLFLPANSCFCILVTKICSNHLIVGWNTEIVFLLVAILHAFLIVELSSNTVLCLNPLCTPCLGLLSFACITNSFKNRNVNNPPFICKWLKAGKEQEDLLVTCKL